MDGSIPVTSGCDHPLCVPLAGANSGTSCRPPEKHSATAHRAAAEYAVRCKKRPAAGSPNRPPHVMPDASLRRGAVTFVHRRKRLCVFERQPAMAAAVILVTLGGFLFAAVFSTIRHRRNFRKRLANGSIQPVPAVFQGYVRREDAENNRVNVPVYLCFWGGRTYRMEIGMGRRPYRPGERVTLLPGRPNRACAGKPLQGGAVPAFLLTYRKIPHHPFIYFSITSL